MEFKKILDEALRIRELYAEYEKKNFGRKWNNEELFVGLISDMGDLSRLILAKEGMMKVDNLNKRIAHEISECLWAILVLAKEYDVDVEKKFFENMKALEKKIKK